MKRGLGYFLTVGICLVVVLEKPAEHLHQPTPPQLINTCPIVAPYTATASTTFNP